MAHVVDDWNCARPHLEISYPVHKERDLAVSLLQRNNRGASAPVRLFPSHAWVAISLVGFGQPEAPDPCNILASGPVGLMTPPAR